MAFALFFLGEYSNMLLMSTLITILFCGGWLLPICNFFYFLYPLIFSLKIMFFCFSFILVRATFPRYRYDQLMNIGWKIFLPLSVSFLVLITSFSLIFNILPRNLF
jgi:NADH-quinone oxidoreductase subunit H